jgi:hypothetical protein
MLLTMRAGTDPERKQPESEPAAPVGIIRRTPDGRSLIFMREMAPIEAAANSPQDAMVSCIVACDPPDESALDAALGERRFAWRQDAQRDA